VLACWLWGAATPRSLAVLQEAGIPTFHSPEAAVRAFDYLWNHAENLRRLSDVTAALAEAREPGFTPHRPDAAVAQARRCGRTVLTAGEWKQLFAAYGLPVFDTRIANGELEALQAADRLEYPVRLSLAPAPWLPGGNEVHLKADSPSALRRAVGSLALLAREHFGADGSVPLRVQPAVEPVGCAVAVRGGRHPELGPILEFGEASQLPAGPRHAVTALPPLTPLTVRELIEQSPAVAAYRAPAGNVMADHDALESFLLNFSRLIVEQRWIEEITVNPLLVSPDRVFVLDARVVLRGSQSDEDHSERALTVPVATG
jgi:acetyltransferase